jgi:hypothetical protein
VRRLENIAKLDRRVIEPKLEGKGPTKRLIFRNRYVRRARFPILLGIGPVREFEDTDNKYRRVKLTKLEGKVDVRRLTAKLKALKRVNLLRDSGSGPMS